MLHISFIQSIKYNPVCRLSKITRLKSTVFDYLPPIVKAPPLQ